MAKRRRGSNQASKGSKWLRPDKRLAIYLRDDHTCLWCNRHCEKVDELQIDHLVPYKGTEQEKLRNHASNLITSCRSCNTRRKDMPLEEYALFVASRTRQKAATIIQRIVRQTAVMLDLYREEARQILAKKDAGDADARDFVQSTRARRKMHYEYGH